MLPTPSIIFEETYQKYLEQIDRLDLVTVSNKLGGQMAGNDLLIPVFGRVFRISRKQITDSAGELPGFDICVIISRYLLLCPDKTPGDKAWSSFRDMQDSGPLTKYFKNEVEGAIAARFAGKVDQLKAACLSLGGHRPSIDASYDCYLQCDALPRIPLLLLFNDAEDEFPATSSVLFERRAQDYLDPECLAMTGRLFYSLLKNAQKRRIRQPDHGRGNHLETDGNQQTGDVKSR